jgi:hypothetical protein
MLMANDRVVKALLQAGLNDQAEAVARRATGPFWQAIVSVTLAKAGRHAAAASMAMEAEAAAWSIGELSQRTQALANVAVALAESGQRKRAAAIAIRAESTARSITDPGWQETGLATAVWALAETGQYRRAEAVANAIAYPDEQAAGLADLGVVLAKTGDNREAVRLTIAACAAGRWLCAARPVFLLTEDVSTIVAHALEEMDGPV